MKIRVVSVDAGTDCLLCVEGAVDVLLEWPESMALMGVESLTLPYVPRAEMPAVSVRVRGQWHSLTADDQASGHFHISLPCAPRALALRFETRVGLAFLRPDSRLSAVDEASSRVHGWITPLEHNPYRTPAYTWSEPSRGILMSVRHQST